MSVEHELNKESLNESLVVTDHGTASEKADVLIIPSENPPSTNDDQPMLKLVENEHQNNDARNEKEKGRSVFSAEDSLRFGAAKELAKAKKYEEAYDIYQSLYQRIKAPKIAAGLSRTLRMLSRLDEASEILDIALVSTPESKLLLSEVGHLRIVKDLQPYCDVDLVSNAALVAQEIVKSTSDLFVQRKAIFMAISCAKRKKSWEIVDQLTSLIDPNSLSTKAYGKQRDAWSDRARWFAAKVVALIETKRCEQALELACIASESFVAQRKFFQRWQAKALIGLSRFDEALELYRPLVKSKKADWWLLQEYAAVLSLRGEEEEAMNAYLRACLNLKKLEMGVKLLEESAYHAASIGEKDLAEKTANLLVAVRNAQGWKIPEKLYDLFRDLDRRKVKEQIADCRTLWRSKLGETDPIPHENQQVNTRTPMETSQLKKRYHGIMIRPDKARAFCFIRSGNESLFCLVSDFEEEIDDGRSVSFEKIKAFDRKKNKDSYRAIAVRLSKKGANA